MNNKNQSLKWLRDECADKIIIEDNRILDYENPIRGVYGIFIRNSNDFSEYCAYVGKSVNIYKRMFSSSGHITKLMYGEMPIKKVTEALTTSDSTIIIRILDTVPFEYDEYHKDVQRLASAECKYIDHYQSLNQCLEQVPEGVSLTDKEWQKRKDEIENGKKEK